MFSDPYQQAHCIQQAILHFQGIDFSKPTRLQCLKFVVLEGNLPLELFRIIGRLFSFRIIQN